MKIGILGGSFNPAHKGHLYISNLALKLLQLDEIWWLVSPQNPLKHNVVQNSMKKRLYSAREISKGYKIRVEDLESRFNTNLTANAGNGANKAPGPASGNPGTPGTITNETIAYIDDLGHHRL